MLCTQKWAKPENKLAELVHQGLVVRHRLDEAVDVRGLGKDLRDDLLRGPGRIGILNR